jgi:hypothetical protein
VGRFPEREIEEPVELSGAEKKRSCADPDLRVWGGVLSLNTCNSNAHMDDILNDDDLMQFDILFL